MRTIAVAVFVVLLPGCGGADPSVNEAEAARVAEAFVQRLMIDRRLESALDLAEPAAQFHLPSYYRRYVIRGDLQPIADVELQEQCESTGFGARTSDQPCFAVDLCGAPFSASVGRRKTIMYGTLYIWIGGGHQVEAHAHMGGFVSYPADEAPEPQTGEFTRCVKQDRRLRELYQ